MVLCILPPLLNLFCICYVLTISILFCVHLSMKYSLDISYFVEEISSPSHSLFSSISLHCSLKKPFLSFLAILWSSAFRWIYLFFLLCLLLLFFSQLSVRPPQTTILPSCISFSSEQFWSLPAVQCYKPPSIVLMELCLPDLIPRIYLSFLLYNHKGFDLGHT